MRQRPNQSPEPTTLGKNMKYERPAFEAAIAEFKTFLLAQRRSARLTWITREQLTRRNGQFWLFLPSVPSLQLLYESYYDSLRATSTSIRIDAFATLADMSLVYVEDYGGDGGHLNFGCPKDAKNVKIVRSKILWWIICLSCRLPSARRCDLYVPNLADIQKNGA